MIKKDIDGYAHVICVLKLLLTCAHLVEVNKIKMKNRFVRNL